MFFQLIDLNNGFYRCERCDREFDRFSWRFISQLKLIDPTGHIWATCFQDQAEEVPAVGTLFYKASFPHLHKQLIIGPCA